MLHAANADTFRWWNIDIMLCNIAICFHVSTWNLILFIHYHSTRYLSSLWLFLCCVLLRSYETSLFMWVLVWGESINTMCKQPRAHVTRDRWQHTWGTNAGMQDNYWCLQILEWSFENINLHLFGLTIIIILRWIQDQDILKFVVHRHPHLQSPLPP